MKLMGPAAVLNTSNSRASRPPVGAAAGTLAPEAMTLAPAQWRAKAGEAAALLRALANPDRLLLLCQLVDAERSVGELGALTGITQPSLSQQLAVLRGERLVATRREGKHVRYSVASPAALAVLRTLYGLFCEPIQAPPTVKRRAATPRPIRKEIA